MDRKEHYQRMASECLKLSRNSSDSNKVLLLEMAMTWVRLAEQVRDAEIIEFPSQRASG
jgi:hypothetical protein